MIEPATFAQAATDILGPGGFTQDPDLLEPWLTDWRGRFTGRAIGMAAPASTSQLAALVRLCAEHDIPIVPQGGNSGMSGGATPDDSGTAVLLSLRRMNAIRSIDREAREVVCEAGVILQSLHEYAGNADLRFPLTLGGKGSATVGGLISTNAGGTQVIRHGTMRAHVRGIEAVLPSGDVFNSLTPLKKDNRGFDLKQLFIGSEGTLGIVTAATLALAPRLRERCVIWAGMDTIEDARRLLVRFQSGAASHLEGFEILPRHCLESVLNYLPGARAPLASDTAWHALIELGVEIGDPADPAEIAHRLLEDALGEGAIADATIAASDSQAEAFWALRDSVAPAERARGPAVQHDISVPVQRMAQFIAAAGPEVEAAFPGTTVAAFGHLGDGNIHFHVLAPAGADPREWSSSTGRDITRLVHDLVTGYGGSISAEHGIGQMKRDELARLGDPVTLALMRLVKAAIDPRGLLNPGKLVPLAPTGPST